ncbi:DUF2165 family protein [Campylobacter insulaenigrae]|uniref:DUF2165 family protein n=1 Tax=Campylobacter insulaenigrae TaxID=260714 RepID=UPI0021535C27|nr:DUF2165 family protein [Campylobacter insulaenigrae]MCR6571615.1 DUF2165 family protein [Campylobacter insulaenigrae]MCR6577245.1 DUF2165 family protein [Campylobacter insulaenigrae]MCR6582333.1 DUF2165 family protein [Campylobacter insulaenigrae]MCR6584876.1 DUF2165 family protein [Campylobacter insulaenigrae]MCR6588140.1 DUF2165 family protein [Campylobacter insulaenigrae]
MGNAIVYRAILNPMHHSAYIFIICFEAFIMLTAFKGALDMFKARNLDAKIFINLKNWNYRLSLLLFALVFKW